MLRLLFMPYVAIEVICAYFFISEYGFLPLVLEVIATAVLGMFFMFQVGFFQLISRIVFLKPSDIFGVLGMPIGGFFLFIPGVATDVLGVVVIIFALFSNLKNQPLKKEREGEYYSYRREHKEEDGEIIDVEVVEEERKYK
ncbi:MULTISPECIES: FxsA family protein [unclassified Campylobacter]|uniref:FxsA family protein n=1 Tax=unclassified Campylobacter TaxID=2593542 RepID=UPI00147362B4|nr:MULTISPECIES: FxsA family protein [unclassified Campylobacter]